MVCVMGCEDGTRDAAVDVFAVGVDDGVRGRGVSE